MSRFILSLALCLFAAPAFGTLVTVTDGQHLDKLALNPNRDLLMTGGSIEYLDNMGGVATLEGGVLTSDIFSNNISRVGKGGTIIIRGSDAGIAHQYLETRFNEPYWGKSTIIWEGLYSSSLSNRNSSILNWVPKSAIRYACAFAC